jgi:hypothetical protein
LATLPSPKVDLSHFAVFKAHPRRALPRRFRLWPGQTKKWATEKSVGHGKPPLGVAGLTLRPMKQKINFFRDKVKGFN